MLTSNLGSGQNSEQFRLLVARIMAQGARFGKVVRGYRDPSLPLFSAAKPARQASILQSLRILGESFDNDEVDFFEAEKRALWKSALLLGLVPPPDPFNELQPDRAIEIFGVDGGLLWRNLECMDLCSYTLEEIACIDVFDRYSRSPELEAQCIGCVQGMLNGTSPDVMDPEIPAYTLTETNSAERFILSIKHELTAVLKNRHGAISAWLVMSSAKVVGTDIPPPERRPHQHLSVVP